MARFIVNGSLPSQLLNSAAHASINHNGIAGVGRLLQVPIEVSTTADLSTTLDHDLDDTPPLDTETGLALTLNYTPTIPGSTTFVRATIHLGASTTTGVGAGLWLNSETTPRSWSVERIIDTGTVKTFECWYRFAHGNTNLQTWQLRYSTNQIGQTCYVNRSGNGPKYANTLITSLEVREIQE